MPQARASKIGLFTAAAMGLYGGPTRAEEPQIIIVTGNRLPADAARQPVSLTRVDGDALHTAQYEVNLSESLARVPGLIINNRQNYAQDLQISMRGFGARSSFGVRGIRLYTDGIPAAMPDGQGQVSHFDLASAEAITVLRGPYSALYGASSGGAIELTTAEPKEDAVEAQLSSSAFGTQRYALQTQGRFGDLSALGSASYFETAGYRAHSAARRYGGQARLGYDFGGDGGQLVVLANTVDIKADDPLGLTRAQYDADPRQASANAEAYDTRKTVQQSQLGAAWTRPLGSQRRLRVVAWFGNRETVQFQAIPDTVQASATHPGGIIDLDRDYYGTDLRWTLDATLLGRPLQWTTGLDTQWLDEHRLGYQNFTGTAGPGSVKGVQGALRRDENNRVYGVDPYTQADWRFAPRWAASLGLRYSNTSFDSDDRYIAGSNGDDSGQRDYHALLPVLGLNYNANTNLDLHAAVSRGSETPTLNELAYRADGSAGLNPDLDAARSRNAEVGARWKLAETLSADLTLFDVDTKNEIVVASSSGGRTSYRNADGTQRSGVEAGTQWQPMSHLEFTGAYSYLDAHYDDGRRLPGTALHNLYGELAWKPAPGALIALESLYRSSVYVNDANDDAASSYAVCNLRASLPLRFGAWSGEVFARIDNLLDRRYAGSVIVNESNGRYFEPAPDRAFGVGLSLRWKAG